MVKYSPPAPLANLSWFLGSCQVTVQGERGARAWGSRIAMLSVNNSLFSRPPNCSLPFPLSFSHSSSHPQPFPTFSPSMGGCVGQRLHMSSVASRWSGCNFSADVCMHYVWFKCAQITRFLWLTVLDSCYLFVCSLFGLFTKLVQ